MSELRFLTVERFGQIKRHVLEAGQEVIWSSLYGGGHLLEFGDIEVIFTPAASPGQINGPWNEFLRLDSDNRRLSFVVFSKGSKLDVRDDSEHYFENVLEPDRAKQEADRLFGEVLEIIERDSAR